MDQEFDMRYRAGQTIDLWGYIRDRRDGKLKASDWTQMSDSPLSDSKKTEWATYRQTLRDIPATHASKTAIADVPFPDKPS